MGRSSGRKQSRQRGILEGVADCVSPCFSQPCPGRMRGATNELSRDKHHPPGLNPLIELSDSRSELIGNWQVPCTSLADVIRGLQHPIMAGGPTKKLHPCQANRHGERHQKSYTAVCRSGDVHYRHGPLRPGLEEHWLHWLWLLSPCLARFLLHCHGRDVRHPSSTVHRNRVPGPNGKRAG